MADERNGFTQRALLGGRYRVEEELGRGGMARVFRGTDTVLGRPVAIKILAPQFAEDANFVTRFRREAQAAARLNNPHVVGVYDTGSDDGIHFIVMEYVEAKTLADFLAGGSRILPDRAIELAESVCEALAVAHAAGIVHRDVKPANIMVARDGSVKVTDFGIARLTTSADTVAQTAAVLGTASYLSPEQAQGQPVDQRSDLYSLGAVLYEMVAGQPPFSGDTAVAVASKHVLEQPVPPSQLNPDVSPELDAVIMKALAKNPANRYQTAQEFRADLERAHLGRPVEATPLLPEAATTQAVPKPEPTAVLSPSQPAGDGRRRWWIGALIGVLIAAVLGGGLYLLATGLLRDNNPVVAQVAVPPVTGLKLAEARAKIEDAGLKVATPIDRVEDSSVEPGTVLEQSPEAGAEVDEGSEVTLTVAEAPLVTIPTGLVGQPADEVRATLKDLNLVVDEQRQASTGVPAGRVISLNPPEGTPVDEGSTVTMVVSTGPNTVEVPDLSCLGYGQAKAKLDQLGLNIELVGTMAPNPLCPNGAKIVAQSPDPGGPVQPGSTVQVWVAGEETPSPSPEPSPSPTPSPSLFRPRKP
jgi:beta-lactam-binding protein with PASTA domain/tRNA A-37 threonylcarbamoyl transferase component Bud32